MHASLSQTPREVAARLRASQTGRAWLVRDPSSGRLRSSPGELEAVARELSADAESWQDHEAVFLAAGEETGALLAAFVHRVERGQAQGGLRHCPYPSLRAFLIDGLRLSRGMGRKCALARLWWGGGKGIIARDEAAAWRDPAYRRALYADYGRFVTSLQGCYVTAEDAGTTPCDLAEIHRHTRFATCIPAEVGGSGNPSSMTATGVVRAIEAALDFVEAGPLAGKRIAMQGGGNVGSFMIEQLLEADVAQLVVAELSAEQRCLLLDRFGDERLEVRAASPGDDSILATPCDVLVPNALGGVLDDKTIPSIGARVVCGAANNPLARPARDARALADRGIVFVPDYLANRMGIVACSNEQAGHLPEDPLVRRHLDRDWDGSIYCTTRRILETAEREGVTPIETADREADLLIEEPHPIWGGRARQIVQHLIEGGWERGGA